MVQWSKTTSRIAAFGGVMALFVSAACGESKPPQSPDNASASPQATSGANTNTMPPSTSTPPPSDMGTMGPGSTSMGAGQQSMTPNSTSPTNGTGTYGTTGTTMDTGTSFNDEQIAAVIVSLNNGETQAAQVAQSRATNAKVKQYAQMMLTEHTDATKKSSAIMQKQNISPSSNTTSTQLDTDSKQMVDSLRSKSGADFDKEYIDHMVKSHTEALTLIDSKLMPNVKSTELKAEIQRLRPRIQEHLTRAKDIQTQLGSTGGRTR